MGKNTDNATSQAAASPFSSEVNEVIEQPSGRTVDPDSLVFETIIPGSLIGRRFVAAADEAEAAQKYKAPSGITSHTTPLTATLCEFTAGSLPEGVELFG